MRCRARGPREMERLMQDRPKVPDLREPLYARPPGRRSGGHQDQVAAHRRRRGERIDEWIDTLVPKALDPRTLMHSAALGTRNSTVGLSAHSGAVDIRITARAASEQDADLMISDMEAAVCARIDEACVFGSGTLAGRLEEVTARLLA